jgi:hypothetical protein
VLRGKDIKMNIISRRVILKPKNLFQSALTVFLVSLTGACANVEVDTVVPESTGITTTTSSPVVSPTKELPIETDCLYSEILADTGEEFRDVLRCVDGWAVGIPQRFVDKFDGDTNAEGEWVLANQNQRWVILGVCHIWYPIYASGLTCNHPVAGTSIDLSLIPPMPVQCVLWFGASLESALPETGCPITSSESVS